MSVPESFETFHDGSHEDLSLEGRGTLNPDLFVFTVGSREAAAGWQRHQSNIIWKIYSSRTRNKSHTINKNEAMTINKNEASSAKKKAGFIWKRVASCEEKQKLKDKYLSTNQKTAAWSASSPVQQGHPWWDRCPWRVTLGYQGPSQEDSEKL